jgi:NAD(P)H dehydrogenase (quinone)
MELSSLQAPPIFKENEMPKIIVLYYSAYGHIQSMANAVAEGVRRVPDVDVDVRRVPETIPEDVREKSGYIKDDTVMATVAGLEAYDAIIIGTPTRFGLMAGQMKLFLDAAGGLWARNSLVGKVGAVFTSTGTQHGGQEATILSSLLPLLHYGMIVVGLPYSFTRQMSTTEIVGGSPYGPGTIVGPDGSRAQAETDYDGVRFQGEHVARIVHRLFSAEA